MKLCHQASGIGLEASQVQSIRNFEESIRHVVLALVDLENVRKVNPTHHQEVGGITQEGKSAIFRSTVNFHNAIYLSMNSALSVVTKHGAAFKNPGTKNSTFFLRWLASHDDHKFAVNNSLILSKSFRTLVTHPQDVHVLNWVTHNNSLGSLYIVLQGLGQTSEDKATQECVFREGPGWYLPSPEENLTAIVWLDVAIWILLGILGACNRGPSYSDQNWHRKRKQAFSDLLSEDENFVVIEFRRNVPESIHKEVFSKHSVFS